MSVMPNSKSNPVESFQRVKPPDLSRLDGRSVAVILRQAEREFVIRGTAVFQRDDALGNVLCITVGDEQTSDPRLIISEGDWKGRIIPDVKYGCDLCIIPAG